MSSSNCHICHRAFHRLDHLKRHYTIHLAHRSYRCDRCQRTLSRKDSLQRHQRTCPGTEPSLRSGFRRACSNCSSKKRRCGRQHPTCEACCSSGEQCIYRTTFSDLPESHAEHETGRKLKQCASNVPPNYAGSDAVARYRLTRPHRCSKIACADKTYVGPTIGTESDLVQYISPPLLSPTTSFTFLVHVTKCYDLQRCFEDRGMERLCSQTIRTFPSAQPQNDLLTVSGGTLATCVKLSYPYESLVNPVEDEQHRSDISDEALARRYVEIRSALMASSLSWSANDEHGCSHFFTPSRILYNLDLYWTWWYPNWPVIHKPTFSLQKCPTLLLTAMVVMGACHSKHNTDRTEARKWFVNLERLALTNLDTMSDASPLVKNRRVQAAFLVCIMQTWDGDHDTRTHTRRVVFDAILSACKDDDLLSVRHNTLPPLNDFDWPSFVRKEEIIRTLLWVFCLDTAFVIFNNSVPRLLFQDLRMGLASCETSFQAESADACYSALRVWQSHCTRLRLESMFDFVKRFFIREPSSVGLNNLAHEPFMNLWCVLCALHTIRYLVDPNSKDQDQLIKLRTAVDNWKRVWNRRLVNADEQYFDVVVAGVDVMCRDNMPRDMWKRTGFWSNAAEYWLLIDTLLEKMEMNQSVAVARSHVCSTDIVLRHACDGEEDESMDRLHNLLLHLVVNAT